MWHHTKILGHPWAPFTNIWHPGLRKRINRVLECSLYGQVRIHMLDAYKNNKCYFFAQVFALHMLDEELSKLYGRPIMVEVFNKPMPCFFLGSHPLYWVWEWKGFGYANDAFWGNRWAIGLEPFIPLVDMGIFRDIAPDRWEIYLKPDVIEQYKAQKYQLEERKKWQMLCLAKNYPREEVKPTRIVQTPRGPGTYDLPIPNIKLPTIDAPPFPPGTAWRMVIEFWQTDQNTLDSRIHYPAALAPGYI